MPIANVANSMNTKDVFPLIQDLLFKAGICSSPPEILHLALLFICRTCLVILKTAKSVKKKNLLKKLHNFVMRLQLFVYIRIQALPVLSRCFCPTQQHYSALQVFTLDGFLFRFHTTLTV